MEGNVNKLSELENKVKQFEIDAIADIERMKENTFVQKEESVESDIDENSENSWEQYRNGYYFYKERYEAIRDATFWKMTKPLRNASDWFRWKTTGVKREYEAVEFSRPAQKKNAKAGSPQIGVHVHLYYEDLLDEFCRYLNNIPESFDLYVSCRADADISLIKEKASRIAHVQKITVRKGPNRGRDIAPFYVLFGHELLNYEILLHVHTKKSLYTGEEKKEWRQWALEGVLKDEKAVADILSLMRQRRPNIGLIFGEMTPTLPLMALHWLYNSQKGQEVLSKLHIRFENHMLFYPVGSFFWVKTQAIRPLFDMGMTYESFDEEKGQIDGTLAHALERVIACVVKGRGYGMYIFDPETNHFSFNISYKCFYEYFNYNVENISALLIRNYDVISFDIFDTLITRCVYAPDDVFRLMSRILQERDGKNVDFLRLRKEAEKKAWEEYGDFCNIHNIYEKLPIVSAFSAEEAECLKQMEIDLELKFCIPRKEVLDIFNRVLAAGKRIILISDMYLTSEIIEKMLKKCGYEGYSELWISCEKGKRKDRGNIWDDFFARFGSQRTIHIGDNPHSDIQIVGDLQKNTLLLLSPVEQFRLSNQFDKFERFLDGSAENSLIMGYLVNKCLYNSPFALNERGFSVVNSIEDTVEGLIAPLFLKFMDYLHNTSHSDTILLFLSREGYFLQKLYQVYCKVLHKKELENKYFLTSRRVTSVAQLDNYNDAKELLQREYSGKLSTLLSERFGLSNIPLSQEQTISLPGEMSKVIPELIKNAKTLLLTAACEKDTYLKYIHQTLGDKPNWSKMTVVDVGYAGTIQYYLMKILNTQLDGCYLVTAYHMKPDALDGTYRSVYSFWKSRMFENTQLFLEAVTAAPHGQVVNFYEKDGKLEPHLKEEDSIYGENAKIMQQFIYRYFENIGQWTEQIRPHFSKDLAELIFSEILRTGILDPKVRGMFRVNDEYCMDGDWIYDEKQGDWKLQRKNEEMYLKAIKKR